MCKGHVRLTWRSVLNWGQRERYRPLSVGTSVLGEGNGPPNSALHMKKAEGWSQAREQGLSWKGRLTSLLPAQQRPDSARSTGSASRTLKLKILSHSRESFLSSNSLDGGLHSTPRTPSRYGVPACPHPSVPLSFPSFCFSLSLGPVPVPLSLCLSFSSVSS